MPDVLSAMVSIALLLFSIVTQPERATCPRGWWMPEGARDGAIACRPISVGGHPAAAGNVQDTSIVPPGELRSRIYCTSGMRIAQDGTSAWCERP